MPEAATIQQAVRDGIREAVADETPSPPEPPKNVLMDEMREHFKEEEEVGEVADEIEHAMLNGELSEEDLGLDPDDEDDEDDDEEGEEGDESGAYDEQGDPQTGYQMPSYEQLAENYENVQRALKAQRYEGQQREQLAAQHAYQLALQQAYQQPQEAPIDVNEDPVGFFTQKTQQLENQLQQNVAVQQAYLAEQQQRAELGQLKNMATASEAEFKEAVPDYDVALDHWRGSRFQELAMIHPQAPREMVLATIQNDEAAIVANAARLGVNPAQYAYEMAMSRGYQPGQYQEEYQGYDESDGGSNLPPRGPDGRFYAEEEGEDDLDALRQEGRQFSHTLSGTGSPRAEQNVSHMLRLQGDEFKQAWDKMKRTKASSLFR